MADVLLTQCINLVNQIVKMDMMAFINIQVGDNFSFVFDNKKYLPREPKKKSPSQEKRNIERTIHFKRKMCENEQKDDAAKTVNVKKEAGEKEFVKAKNEIEIKSEKEEAKPEEVFCDTITMEPQINPMPCSERDFEEGANKILSEKGIEVDRVIFIKDASRDLRRIAIKLKPTSKAKIENGNLRFFNCKILHIK